MDIGSFAERVRSHVGNELFHKDVSLVFLKEPHINTETYKKAVTNRITMTGDKVDLILDGVNKYLMELAREQIRIAFEQAQKEVSDLHQRTKEGIETARLNGKQIGQRKGTTYETQKAKAAKDIIRRHNRSFGVGQQIFFPISRTNTAN